MKVSEEVIEAMQRALERDGFLQGIRAQLRSNVAKIIKDGDTFHRPTPVNIQYFSSKEGMAALLVVRDFLQKLNLKESLMVLEAEAGCQEPVKETDYQLLSQRLELNDHSATILEQLLDSRLSQLSQPPKSALIDSSKEMKNGEDGKSASPPISEPTHNAPSEQHKDAAKPTTTLVRDHFESRDSKYAKVDDSFEEESGRFEDNSFSTSKSEAPPDRMNIHTLASDSKDVTSVSPKYSSIGDLPPLKNTAPKPSSSLLGALPDLKVPSRFNVTAADILPTNNTSTPSDSKQSKDISEKDEGPEIDSEVEEKPEEEEEFSQLDYEEPYAEKDNTHADAKHESGPSARAVVVDSKATADHQGGAGVGRANVQRVAAGSRSTRGWNLPSDSQQDFEDSREDEGDDPIDQMQSSSSRRAVLPGRGGSSPQSTTVPGRNSNRSTNHDHDLDLSTSQQLSVMEDLEENVDESHDHYGQRNIGNNNNTSVLQTSRRSNQEEEEEDDERDHVDQINDDEDNLYDLDGEDEFSDDVDLPIGGHQPTSSTHRTEEKLPTKLFTTGNKNESGVSQSNEKDSKVNISAATADEEYGDDDFEKGEESVMDAEEEEEIPSIIEEEEELSVGAQSNEDDDNWQKSSSAPPAAAVKKESGSMFQQRPPAIIPSSSTARRHDFSALNDYDDDDDEDGGVSSTSAGAKRLAEIDHQLNQMEKDDDNLRKIRESYGNNDDKGKSGGVLPDTTGDEISVASDSMVESFNADDD